jgi:uncharacterized protein with GYD domain
MRFITLLTFTEQGLAAIQKSPARADTFIEMADRAGCKVNALYWTVGGFDGILSLDAPDETTATALMIKLSSAGNVRTHTLRAFRREEIEGILATVSEL